MLFASTIFLLAFLPSAIFCYYAQKVLAGNKLRNTVLLLFSYLFYLYGAAHFTLLLIASTVADYLFGIAIERYRKHAKVWVALSICINLGLLAYYKYANFLVVQMALWLPGAWSGPFADWTAVLLPIGISFFTFQKLSYIIDVYRGQVRSMTSFIDFALFVAMFPQLVAGPIVRFKDICEQLQQRHETLNRFYTGVVRFCWGLAKKVLIADACGQIADAVFGLDATMLDTKTAWLGAIAYTFQIYVDFSAYSDMAIGLARLFGFELNENFNRPYAAVSITDFWHRWHISLSTWFRDYLYIPLGGNRKGAVRTAVNLLTVFGLCGLWHGANWTFVAWGFFHGFFLVVERITRLRQLSDERWHLIRRTATFAIVIFGWVLFRSETILDAFGFIKTMLVPIDRPLPFSVYDVLHHRNLFFLFLATLAFLGAAHFPTCEALLDQKGYRRVSVSIVVILLLLPYCTAFIISGTGNPFIYFRF